MDNFGNEKRMLQNASMLIDTYVEENYKDVEAGSNENMHAHLEIFHSDVGNKVIIVYSDQHEFE